MALDRERVAEIFAEALERPADERSAFLDSRCATSADLRAEVASLLAAHERSEGFLSRLDEERGAALLATTPEPDGRRVGPYRLRRELGRGGMGVVYLAERVEGGFEQRAAVKLVKRGMDTDAILQRFLRERQILARLEHPNIARLLDGGATEEGQPYFAMEYVDGVPLTASCDALQLGVDERLRLFEEAARAVQYAHGQLVVHRDLKPSNILVTRNGQLKLLDFGVAKLLADGAGSAETALTQAGPGPMTPEYAAPEQVRGEPVTTATDVYALGLVLYELLTGRRPFAGESREALARATCENDPLPPSQALAAQPRLARRLRGDLDAVVLCALSKEPPRRYASAEALAEEVRRHRVGQPVRARPDSVRYRTAKFVRRHRLGVAAAAAATLSLLLGLVGTLWQARVASLERDAARLEAAKAQAVQEFLVGLFKAGDPWQGGRRKDGAQELLERGLERLDTGLLSQPDVRFEVLDAVADIHHSLGRYDLARSVAEKSLALAEATHGPEHVLTSRAKYRLALALSASGDFESSERRYREALAVQRRILPADDLRLAKTMSALAAVLTTRSQLPEAEALLGEALPAQRRGLGARHFDTAVSLSTLGNLLHAKADYAAAEAAYREAHDAYRDALGEDSLYVARTLAQMGSVRKALGDNEGAARHHRQALDIRKKLLGEEHPEVAAALQNVAAALHGGGQLREAEELYRRAIDMDTRLLGAEHATVALMLANRASVLGDLGRVADALPLFQRSIALQGRTLGADHPRVALTMATEARMLITFGRIDEARPLAETARTIAVAKYGEDHPQSAAALSLIARLRAASGAPEEAVELYQRALARQRRNPGPAHPATIDSLAGLGEALMALDRATEAEPILREAVASAATLTRPRHWRRADIESTLGGCLSRLGKRDEAGPLLRSGLDALRQALGDGHPLTRAARRRLEEAARR